MVVLDKLRKVGNYVRKGWSSTNPDSYSHYRRGRERQRKQAERGREEADRFAAPLHPRRGRLKEPDARPELAHEDGPVVLLRLVPLLESEHVAIPPDRARAVADVQRHVIESLQAEGRHED